MISIVAGNTRVVGFAVASDLLAQSGYQVPVALARARLERTAGAVGAHRPPDRRS
ncbi:hypothetical protein M8494_29365 [Serratia ureilytica]